MFKRIIKKALVVTTILIAIVGIGGYIFIKQKIKAETSQLILPQTTYTVPFVWDTVTINNKFYNEAAMLIPVKLNGCPKIFYMQFDLGTFVTHFYKPTLDAINTKYKNIPYIVSKDKKGDSALVNYNFKIGETEMKTKEIKLSSFGDDKIDWNDTSSITVIGSVGPDLIDDRTICIDYPNKKMTVYPVLPDSISKTIAMYDCEWYERKVILPIRVKDKKYKLLFDTGSSTYEFLTNKKTANKIAASNPQVEDYKVGSWGNQIDCHDIKIAETFKVANSMVKVERISYLDDFKFTVVSVVYGTDGLTGNKLFLGKKLYIDTKNQKFAIRN